MGKEKDVTADVASLQDDSKRTKGARKKRREGKNATELLSTLTAPDGDADDAQEDDTLLATPEAEDNSAIKKKSQRTAKKGDKAAKKPKKDKKHRRDRHANSDGEGEQDQLISTTSPTADGADSKQIHGLSNAFSRRKQAAQEPAANERSSLEVQAPGSRRLGSRAALGGFVANVAPTLARCFCFGGSLRQRENPADLSPLNDDWAMRLRSLDPALLEQCQIEVYLQQTDDLPFALAGPQLRIHLVNACTGVPLNPPKMTRPGRFNSSSHVCSNSFQWHESVRLPCSMKDFLAPSTLLIAELVQRKKRSLLRQSSHNKSGLLSPRDNVSYDDEARFQSLYRRLAFVFFRPVSGKGNVMMPTLSPLNGSPVEAMLRLQMYQYQYLTWMDWQQARTQWQYDRQAGTADGPARIPTVFLQYQKRRRVRCPSTLHVSIAPVVRTGSSSPLATASPAIPASGGPEGDNQTGQAVHSDQDGNVDNQDSHLEHQRDLGGQDGSNEIERLHVAVNHYDPLLLCRRGPLESCLIPQRHLYQLYPGKKGCSCLQFSPCGRFLAAGACLGQGIFHVHVYHASYGQLLHAFEGHEGIIYAIQWRHDSQELVSASSDGSVRTWAFSVGSNPSSVASRQIYGVLFVCHHVPTPCFAYCADWHPTKDEWVLSGASDGQIRIWSARSGRLMSKLTAKQQQQQQDAVTGSGKIPAVQSIRIDAKNARMFSGDASGEVAVWMERTNPATPDTLHYELVRTIRTATISGAAAASVTGLQLHPRKQHLLVQTQCGLFQYELRSFLLLNKPYLGVRNEHGRIRSAFSPDGRYVVSGSDDGIPFLFMSVHGRQFESPDPSRQLWGAPLYLCSPVLDVCWSPTAHIVALCSYGGNYPIVLLCAHRGDDDVGSLAGAASQDVAEPRLMASTTITTAAIPPSIPTSAPSKQTPSDTNERVQRALERRRQRLQAKLALETAASTAPTATVATNSSLAPPPSSTSDGSNIYKD